MDCLFCKIAKKEMAVQIVYEDSAAVGFLDIRPMAPGHTMVVPKVHVATMLELEKVQVGPIFVAVQQVAARLMRAFSPDGLSYGINQGKASGQEVQHLHIHVVPRWLGDGGRSFQSIVHNAPKEDLKAIAEKIRSVKM